MSEQKRTKLEVQGVSKHFTLPTGEPVIAVSDISFDVHENEFCASGSIRLRQVYCSATHCGTRRTKLRQPHAGRE